MVPQTLCVAKMDLVPLRQTCPLWESSRSAIRFEAMGPQPSRQILGLDLLRIAAATGVMFFHLTYLHWQDDAHTLARWPPLYRAMSPVTSTKWVGVEVFFVLSGFVIMYSAEKASASTFARRRLMRLLPSALLCASMTAALILTERLQTFGTVAMLWVHAVTFWPRGPWIDGVYWTLPIEVAFYTLIYLCLLTRCQVIVFGAVSAMGMISTAWCLCGLQRIGTNPAFLLQYGCFFALGTGLFTATRYGWTGRSATLNLACLAGCIAEIRAHPGPITPLWVWLSAMICLFVSVRQNQRLQTLLTSRGVAMVRRLGLATYPLYLMHSQIGRLMIGGLHRGLKLGYGLELVCTCGLLITASVWVSETAEPWLRAHLGTALRQLGSAALNRNAPFREKATS